MVDEDPDAPTSAGSEVPEVVGQVVDAAEVLDDDTLEAQVVAPDLLDQLRVVPPLDVDPALPRDPRPRTGYGDRPGRRTGGRG